MRTYRKHFNPSHRKEIQKPNKLKENAFLIPIFVAVLILLGILRQMLFYYFFNIPITHYLETSEVLVLFTSDITVLVFPILLLLFLFVRDFSMMAFEMWGPPRSQRMAKAFTKFYSILDGIVVIVLPILYFMSHSFKIRNNFDGAGIVILIAFCLVLFADFIFNALIRKNLVTWKESPLDNAIWVVIVLGVIAANTIGEAQECYERKYQGTQISTKDSIFVADSNRVYLGSTSKYTFMYDRLNQSAIIIPNSEIKTTFLKLK
jgi:hypothetical protein